MIGIGGAGMSGIAEVLHKNGHEVTGSDLKESPYTRRLKEAGVTVYVGHAASQVAEAQQVVISTAIPSTNPELLEAHRRSIPVFPGQRPSRASSRVDEASPLRAPTARLLPRA
jgi:UDP-N-acetylmuramate--alanine ligase